MLKHAKNFKFAPGPWEIKKKTSRGQTTYHIMSKTTLVAIVYNKFDAMAIQHLPAFVYAVAELDKIDTKGV